MPRSNLTREFTHRQTPQHGSPLAHGFPGHLETSVSVQKVSEPFLHAVQVNLLNSNAISRHRWSTTLVGSHAGKCVMAGRRKTQVKRIAGLKYSKPELSITPEQACGRSPRGRQASQNFISAKILLISRIQTYEGKKMRLAPAPAWPLPCFRNP